MTGVSNFFHTYTPCAGNRRVKIADGNLSPIAGIGNIILSSSITLFNVLHVPKLTCNLVSISQLTKDLNCLVKFGPRVCVFQDLASGRTIGSAKEHRGLYILDEGSNSCLKTSVISCDSEIYLWHLRLGHASFYYLKHLFPKLFINKDPASFKCEICTSAKLTKSVYPSRVYQPSKPFSLIHSDIWGPSRVVTSSRKRWFLTLIDDHTRACWVYLLKEKSEVEIVFKQFCSMIQTQFHTCVQMLRSDNGREYFKEILG